MFRAELKAMGVRGADAVRERLRGNPAEILLRGAAKLYGLGTRARNSLFDQELLRVHCSKFPTISIGNVTAGGNAKTPLTVYTAARLKRFGVHPVVLSRGFGGSERGPHLVTSADAAESVGDEPLMLCRLHQLPVVVARRRAEGAKLVEAQEIGDVLLLDDGFQHRRLARLLDIVSIDSSSRKAVERFEAGELLPAGYFREPRDAALARAHAFVLAARQPESAEAHRHLDAMSRLLPSDRPIFRSFFVPRGVTNPASGRVLEPSRIGVFCGIASPAGLRTTLESLGFAVADLVAFPDHHRFSAADMAELRHRFQGLPLVCTEKDYVKLPIELARDVFVIGVDVTLDDAQGFDALLQRALRSRDELPESL